MANIHECPNCGAALNDGDKQCQYCGSANPNYVERKTIRAVISNAATEIKNAKLPVEIKKFDSSNVNWIIAVLLIVCCWPFGILYILIKGYKD